jgi:16S rRNA (uracil1498-N3)-methyltransferase
MVAKIRLYVDQALGPGQPVALTRDQGHYLFAVMRLGPGAELLVFDGRTGEWLAEVAEAGKRGGVLVCREQTRPLQMPPDLWLMFAPVKKARTDFIVEKAVEMGAARILPVQTRRTNAERFRPDKAQAHAVEAAEQCGATCLPEVADLQPLERVLRDWPGDRRLYWADEALAPGAAGLGDAEAGPAAVLIGPEGGFADEERAALRRLPFVTPFGLGPRILRADTAAVAALTLWQAALGDWR